MVVAVVQWHNVAGGVEKSFPANQFGVRNFSQQKLSRPPRETRQRVGILARAVQAHELRKIFVSGQRGVRQAQLISQRDDELLGNLVRDIRDLCLVQVQAREFLPDRCSSATAIKTDAPAGQRFAGILFAK